MKPRDAKPQKPAKVARSEDRAPAVVLTPKQEAFAVAYAVEGMNQTEAYRHAYDTSGMAATTIWPMASILRRSPKVAQRIAELQGATVRRAAYTADDHMDRLAELAAEALKEGQVSAAVKAEELRGKVAGLHIERSLISVEDPAGALAKLLGVQPEEIPG